MSAPKEARKYEIAYQDDVATLADSGWYKKVDRANTYMIDHVARAWRVVGDVDDSPDSIASQLDMTPTMILIVHMFGRAVFRHGIGRFKAPTLDHWPPLWDRKAEHLRFMKAIAKRDIARIIGKSISAVDEAISRFRGRGNDEPVFVRKKLAMPLYVDTGIMFNLCTSAQVVFPFMLEDYEYGKRHATDQYLAQAGTARKQSAFCGEAIASKQSMLSLPTAAEPVEGATAKADH